MTNNNNNKNYMISQCKIKDKKITRRQTTY